MGERTVAIACAECFLMQDTKPLGETFYECGADLIAKDADTCAQCGKHFASVTVERIPDKTKQALELDPLLYWRMAAPPGARVMWRIHQCNDAKMGRMCSKGVLKCPFWHLPWDKRHADEPNRRKKKRGPKRRARSSVCRGWIRSKCTVCPRGIDNCQFEHPLADAAVKTAEEVHVEDDKEQ